MSETQFLEILVLKVHGRACLIIKIRCTGLVNSLFHGMRYLVIIIPLDGTIHIYHIIRKKMMVYLYLLWVTLLLVKVIVLKNNGQNMTDTTLV